MVPGGGLTLEGTPTAWVRRRIQEAAKIYKEKKVAGEVCRIVTLSGGTPHKPMPVDARSGFQVFEAEGNARALVREFDIPPEDIFEEGWSLDTIGNAFILRMVHCEAALWRRLLVVNNEFHMPRTQAIFEKVFNGLEPPGVGPYELEFVEVPNDGVEGEVLQARLEREAKSTIGFKKNTEEIQTIAQMHRFVFEEHMAYASKRLVRDRDPVDPKSLVTY